MTEQEWLTSSDPARMLGFFFGDHHSDTKARHRKISPPSDRKLRLFACACKLATGSSVAGTAYAEMLVDGNAPEMLREFHDPLRLAQIWCDWDGLEHLAPESISRRMVTKPARADLLRHIVGNPFRPWVVAQAEKDRRALKEYQILDIDCLTPLVIDLARQLYDGRDVAPILHDALLDAGLLPESDLVRHFWVREADCFVCRIHGLGNPCPHCINGEYATDVSGNIVYCDACDRTGKVGGRHPKGCWALDLILGKE